jgi:hypothetical protein
MNQPNPKTLKLFYDGNLYKEVRFSCIKMAQKWMKQETQSMPAHKKHMYYFEIPSISRQSNPRKR